jgi:hypothetical protein
MRRFAEALHAGCRRFDPCPAHRKNRGKVTHPTSLTRLLGHLLGHFLRRVHAGRFAGPNRFQRKAERA